ncbi:GFA family protein [Halopseudomonas salegens]|uniref:Uncharacterized conserved protein n=1 Tax=Halopseudomonas salegens TaxID=1434072 RepID=A0A1H2F4P5_9GAMM|nr:GFA family protein [Halopseudomonas salegens]SDU02289.1 Uncharacterized conserved protein [Halopseudomonas salegens]
MSEHLGSCLCGTVKFKVLGHFDNFYICHCRYCQKDTGSAHAANLFAQTANLIWLTGAEAVTAFTLPGTLHNKSFCSRCGSALPNEQLADAVLVPAGCLDTKVNMLPTAHIFTTRTADWDDADYGKVPQFSGLPD